jgi:predicted metal-dependent peptidase
MLAVGIVPVIWRNKINDTKKKNLGIAVYVDVSGSMSGILPKVAGIIYSLRKNIKKVFQFSNQIAETSIEELGRGVIRSTGGTDFDCIIEHAVDKGYEKIIIFGDGWAGLSKENEALAKTRISKVCMILTDSGDNKDNFFSQQYKNTYYISEIC